MAFYSERFRREGKEDIWEELKRMMKNPPSEQEIAQKKLGEQAWIDSILDKAFPDKPKPQSEPYLTYEDLLLPEDAEKYRQKQMALAQQKEMTKRNPYDEINSRSDWSEELKAQKRAETAKIQETARQREREINIENAKEHAKNFGGAALEIGSAAIPGYGTAKLATSGAKFLGKKMAPVVGRKIAGQMKKAIATGAVTGGIEGAIRGSLSDDNVAKTIASDAILGAAEGASLGAIGGKIAHNKRVKNFEELVDKRKDWGIAFTKQSGKPAEAIEKLLEQKKGFVPKATKKRGIGDIDFVWGDKGKGLQHIIERRNSEGIDGIQFIRDLPKFIKSSKVYKKKEHLDRKYIGDNQKEASIKVDYNKKPRKWLVSSYNLKEETSSQDLPGVRALEQTYASGQQISPPDLMKTPHNIIPPSQSNLNPNNANAQANLGQSLNQNSTIKPPKSDWEWREWLKRKRKGG